MSTTTSIHGIQEIKARAGATSGAPVSVSLCSEDGERNEFHLFVGNHGLAQRLADAINSAVAEHGPAKSEMANIGWLECPHEWERCLDSPLADARREDVRCTKCGCPGERWIETGVVDWPAT